MEKTMYWDDLEVLSSYSIKEKKEKKLSTSGETV